MFNVPQEGALRGVSMQAYDAHIPYLLQFTTDFNLPPMGWMHLRTAKVRTPACLHPNRRRDNGFLL